MASSATCSEQVCSLQRTELRVEMSKDYELSLEVTAFASPHRLQWRTFARGGLFCAAMTVASAALTAASAAKGACSSCCAQLTAGAAEIFGTALVVGQPVTLQRGSTVAVRLRRSGGWAAVPRAPLPSMRLR